MLVQSVQLVQFVKMIVFKGYYFSEVPILNQH